MQSYIQRSPKPSFLHDLELTWCEKNEKNKKKLEESRKRQEEIQRKKDLKAAAEKKNVVRLSDDLAAFRASEVGQAWKEQREESFK